MKRIFFTGALLLAAASVAQAQTTTPQDYHVGAITIANPWVRAMPKGAKVAAGYMSLTNKGSDADRLVSVSTTVAKQSDVHEMTTDNKGVMRMRPVQGGLAVPAGQTVELKPGSYHIMLMDPNKTLAPGDHVMATLRFEKAGTVEVDFPVKPMGAEATTSKMAPTTAPKMAPMNHMH